MASKDTAIITVIVVVALAVGLWVIFRKFDFTKIFGDAGKSVNDALASVNKSLEDAGQQISTFFDDQQKALDNALGLGPKLKEHDLADKTIDVSDQFGEGATETFSQDTTIDEKGVIDSPSGKELQLGDRNESIVAGFFETQNQKFKTAEDMLKKLTPTQVSEANQKANQIFKLAKENTGGDTLRDNFGLPQVGFTTGDIALRAINAELNQANLVFKDKKTGKKSGFGGFGSFEEQENALQKAILESRKNNPDFFTKLDKERQDVLASKGAAVVAAEKAKKKLMK